MQEQDNAGAPDLLPTSSDPFDAMQAMVEQNLGYPCQTTEDIIAINKFIQAGVQESDIQDALAFFTSNGRVARSAAHIEKSVMTSLGKRVQAANARAGPNGSKPSLADLGYTNISPTFSDAEIQSMLSKHTTEDE